MEKVLQNESTNLLKITPKKNAKVKMRDIGLWVSEETLRLMPYGFDFEDNKFGFAPYEIAESNVNDFAELITDNFMKELGFKNGVKGYWYIRWILSKMLVDNNWSNEARNSIINVMYEDTAKEFNTTNNRAERAIRHSIETAFINNEEGFKDIGITFKPKNSEFMSTAYDYIRLKVKL